MDFDLTADQLAFQQAARAFSDKAFAPHAAAWDEGKVFPRDVIKAAGDMGFCGLYCPEALGGMGLSRLDSSVILEQLAMGCTSTTAFISIHNMASWMIAEYGSDATREAFCPDLVSGAQLASYCLTEAGAGSDAGSLRTQAKRDGDYYVVNGAKMFISGAGATDVLVVMVRTADSGARGISTLVIPSDLPGISFGKNLEKMGWHSQPTKEISFEQVRVPVANRLGKEGDGFKIAMKGLDGGRINIATCSIGTAQAAINRTQTYMLERQQFGAPLASFQALQFKLADMVTELVAARQLVRLAAFKVDKGDPQASVYSAMAKRFATDVGFDVCNQALQIHGGYGYMQEYPLERYLRDTRVHQILEGTNEIMRLIVSRHLLTQADVETIQ
ncbi:MAG: acyl-CoA dehydrogenase family protein [Pseudomonadales bacterium]|nr:acyl-CoA dehydrogenase family protein [Pseudomonadales bacterium]MDP4640334.1 acyl-CoA dehydrogenase family protein [Pseudomonadales bacterium]MDP4765509.1 acyl-CoA dehydrogenase family protein [Pseudomonadales bacterium]MDP4911009.1 acyl-CoA dehydrogenase family protein [Pseudomonadales bacterium]